MKLRRLHIERYRAIRSPELSFLDPLGRVRPVTVLAGPNGSGKTSILIAIVQALRDVIGYRTDEVPPPDDDDVHRLGGGLQSRLHAEPARSQVGIDIQFDKAELGALRSYREARSARERSNDVTPESMLPPSEPLHLAWQYPGRLDTLDEDPHRFIGEATPGLALYWLRLRREALGWFKKARIEVSPFGELFMFTQDRRLAQHVSGEPGSGRSRADSSPGQRGRRDLDSVSEVLKYLSSYATQRDRPLPDSENPELRIRKQLLSLCPPIEYLGYRYQDDDPIGAPYFRNGPSGAPYPLSKAASGLQVILEYLVRLNYPRPLNHSLILIDEPEVHLHPSWARRLYLGLAQLGEDNQFILVTHSAEIRAMAAEDGALIDLGDLDDMDGQDVAPTAGVAEGDAASAADLPKDEDED